MLGALPRAVWDRLALPIRRTAVWSALVSMSAGFFLGVDGFLTFGARTADANNAWMLRQLSSPSPGGPGDAVTLVPYGFSVVSLFVFLFLTPLGWLCFYLVTSGCVRVLSGLVDDPRGDFLLSGLHGAATALIAANRRDRERIGRERREGPEARDVLQTGAWAGLDVDYVVLASRRKPDWDPGAIILTSSDWYRLGVPFDVETPSGLRTAYPLTKMETVEVVRRGIQYELPHLARQRPRAQP